MATFMFVYLGGQYPARQEEAQKHFAAFQQWLASLGDDVISPAVPIKDTHTVHPDRKNEQGSTTGMSGLSIINFPSIAEALEAAQRCPFLDIGGTLEVSEVMDRSAPPQQSPGKPN
ncbi:MAG: hypothetical protein H6980_06125 [Gammaproteobacteria bacterium]|nr:hypothetical protein [Gammaproteobacteria bacterium]